MQTNIVTVNLAIIRNLVPFNFQGIQLKESCWVNGQPHFTRRAIGEFLEMGNPQKAICKIIERNHSIRQFCSVVKLTQIEGDRHITRNIEVFSPTGLQLILLASRQPKAAINKVAVAHLVEACMNGKLCQADVGHPLMDMSDATLADGWSVVRICRKWFGASKKLIVSMICRMDKRFIRFHRMPVP